MKSVSDFEDLVVYQRAYNVSLELHQLTLTMPKVEQFCGIADQLRRASKGICANVAEGYGKQHISKPEFKRYLSMGIGSANEVRVWIRYCRDSGDISDEQYNRFAMEYYEIAKILSSLHSNWK